MAGELAHDAYVSRARFMEHALEFEEKIRHVGGGERTYFRLVFCGDGWKWRQDHLEDFADTYAGRRTGWDHFSAMEAHDLRAKGLAARPHHQWLLLLRTEGVGARAEGVQVRRA